MMARVCAGPLVLLFVLDLPPLRRDWLTVKRNQPRAAYHAVGNLIAAREFNIPAHVAIYAEPGATNRSRFEIRANFVGKISKLKWATLAWAGILGERVCQWGADDFKNDRDGFLGAVYVDFGRDVEQGTALSVPEKLILSHRSRAQSLENAANIIEKRLAELEAVAQEIFDRGFSQSVKKPQSSR